jgi:molybdopterin-containing oxidoreductase family iron-sulfur binding subunit
MSYHKKSYNRRDFLKILGYTAGSTALMASCEQPVRKAIPYLVQPEEIIPGKANYYASTFFEEGEYNSILVKVRDGRPVKIEGNDLSPISKGATSARVQASILELYDPDRIRHPSMNGSKVTWEDINSQIEEKLLKVQDEGKKTIVIIPSIISPSTNRVFELFQDKFPSVEFLSYDINDCTAIVEASYICFSTAQLPAYKFDKSDLVVSFSADFLGSWVSPVEFSKQWSERKQKNDQAKFIQFESGMSITGSNADKRIPINPSQETHILKDIYDQLKGNRKTTSKYTWLVDELKSNARNSMVISGSNVLENQMLVNGINYLLYNFNKTIFPQSREHNIQGTFADLEAIGQIKNRDDIGGVIFYKTNPVYDKHFDHLMDASSSQIDWKVYIGTHPNETSRICEFVCPSNHYLESWDDANPQVGQYSLCQPVIKNIFDSKQAQDIVLKWSGSEKSYKEIIQDYWKENFYTDEEDEFAFEQFWLGCLQKGVFEVYPETKPYSFNEDAFAGFVSQLNLKTTTGIELEVVKSTKGISGNAANNPWLHELPGQISKISWDNFASISASLAKKYELETGDIITINDKINIPVLLQPGQAKNTITVTSGYGRLGAGRVADGVGVNINPLIMHLEKNTHVICDVNIRKTNEKFQFALTQSEDKLNGVDLSGEQKEKYPPKTFYKEQIHPIHHWGMVIDTDACTLCGACIIACQAENNIPVVGKVEMIRGHDMHWIKIDRFYTGDENNLVVQKLPVMCQHCDQAPCENVCPVSATTHSSEGLNQMIYNRCIGTRYCANNCPYQVRRFNWFDYTNADFMKGNEFDKFNMTSDLPRMVLNPDVTVRAKGVIEKCSFCIQRIQEVKIAAKQENRKIRDGEIKTACMQVCPSNAITFGDMNDKESKVFKLKSSPGNFSLLKELGTKPSVSYMAKKRNED